MLDPFEKRVVVEPDVQAMLNGLDETLEMTTPGGKTLGFFVPEAEYRAMVRARLSQDPTAEELEAARNETGGFNITEVLAHLSEVERQWKERQR